MEREVDRKAPPKVSEWAWAITTSILKVRLDASPARLDVTRSIKNFDIFGVY